MKRSDAANNTLVADLGTLNDRADENSTTFQVVLKDGIKHPSGNAITAEDVVFSFMVSVDLAIVTNGGDVVSQKYFGDTNASNDNLAEGAIPDFTDHVKVAAGSTTTINFNLREPYAFADTLIAGVSIIEKAVYQEGYAAGTEDFNSATGKDANGACPYKVKSISLTNNLVVLEPNEHSHKPNGDIERIVLRYYSTTEAALAAFASGDVQIIDSQFAQKEAKITEAGAEAEVVTAPVTQQIIYNHLHPYYGTGAMTPAGKADAENVTVGLEAAGFNYSTLTAADADAEDLEYTDSFFETHVYSPNSNPNRNQWATQITENFRKIGIGFKHESVGWDVLAPRTFWWRPADATLSGTVPIPLQEDGGFDMYFVGYSWALDWDPTGRYDGTKYSPESSNAGNVNYTELNAIVREYQVEPDATKRNVIAKRLQAAMFDFEAESVIVYPSSVWGFDMNLSAYSPLLFSVIAQEWDLLRYAGPLVDGDPTGGNTSPGVIPFYLDVAVVVFGLAGLLGLATLLVKRRSLR